MGTKRLKTMKWAVPSFALAVGLGLTVGYLPALIVYWALNVIGVWMYCDGYGHHDKVRAQKWVRGLSMVLVPTGFIGLMSGGGGNGPSPKQIVSSGSSDDGIRLASARAGGGPSSGA